MHFTLDAVISADMNLIGQLQPRAKVRFVRGDMDPSLAARADRIWMLTRLPKTLAWCQVGMMLGGAPGKTQPRLQTRGRSVDRLRCLPPLHFHSTAGSRAALSNPGCLGVSRGPGCRRRAARYGHAALDDDPSSVPPRLYWSANWRTTCPVSAVGGHRRSGSKHQVLMSS
jgi:hypothetical protein